MTNDSLNYLIHLYINLIFFNLFIYSSIYLVQEYHFLRFILIKNVIKKDFYLP